MAGRSRTARKVLNAHLDDADEQIESKRAALAIAQAELESATDYKKALLEELDKMDSGPSAAKRRRVGPEREPSPPPLALGRAPSPHRLPLPEGLLQPRGARRDHGSQRNGDPLADDA